MIIYCEKCQQRFDTDLHEECPRCDGMDNPGSSEAKARGCTCPVLDNAHGKGYMGGVKDPDSGETIFVVSFGCPLHDKEARNG